MSFEDFLDMLSVFSDSATADIKSYYAFHIFGEAGGQGHVLGSPHLGVGVAGMNPPSGGLAVPLEHP